MRKLSWLSRAFLPRDESVHPLILFFGFSSQHYRLESTASKPKPAVKATPANAWNRPLKAKTTGPPPGMGPADKAKAAPKAKTNGSEIKIVLRERLLHLSLTLVGHKVVLYQTNGAVLEGVFHTFTPFPNLSAEMKNKYVLNAVKTVKQPTSGQHTIKDGSTLIIAVDKVAYIQAKNVNLDRTAANGGPGFGGANNISDVMTDTQISGTRGDKDQELVSAGSAWTEGAGKGRGGALAGGLDDKGGMSRKAFGTARPAGLKGSIGEWDQFKANEELFNVQATYDENLYTTELDKSQIDSRKLAEAERIAKEIENTTSTNLHIAEERGHIVETDFDEEDRYSGVLTKDGKQRHQSSVPSKDGKAAPKKMNYAAAAAKADAGKKVAPSGFVKSGKPVAAPAEEKKDKPKRDVTKKQGETASKKEADSEKKDKAKEAEKPPEKQAKKEEAKEGVGKVKEEKKEEAKEEEKTETKDKPKSKLNAKAKEFTFNPSAKSFTPSFGGGTNFSTPAPQPQHADPNAHMHGAAHPGMQAPHYMHGGPMGQPGESVSTPWQFPSVKLFFSHYFQLPQE